MYDLKYKMQIKLLVLNMHLFNSGVSHPRGVDLIIL
jgi:hypothetical protein